MCQYSTNERNTRDARQNEDLTITCAPHGGSNWLTEPGKPDIAVCIPNKAPLAVQVSGSDEIRGANFKQSDQPINGDYDFLVFLNPNGENEIVALNNLPCGTMVRVLALYPPESPRPNTDTSTHATQTAATVNATPALAHR
ncbi:MAG TPA: hypothetical protein VMT81_03725 [Candidatus Paceibacterota bacterium]|nr:hypothetical protein [Candidatus Paceibacterota bacterium]